MEIADTLAHELIKGKHLAAKQQDREDERLVHQGFDAWWHVSRCENGGGEAIECSSGEADPACELGTVGEGGAKEGSQVGEQMSVVDSATVDWKVRWQR